MKKKVNSYLVYNKWLLIGLVIFSLLSGVANTMWSFVFQKICEISNKMKGIELKKLLIFVLVCCVFYIVSAYLMFYFRRKYLREINVRLKSDVFDAIIGKNINDFTESNSAKYISILNNDVANLENQYYMLIPTIIQNVFVFMGCTFALMYYSVAIAVVVLISAVILVALPFIYGDKISSKEKIVYDELESYNGKLKDLLMGFEVLKSYNAVSQAKKLFKQSTNKVEKARFESRKIQNPYVIFLMVLTYGVIIIQLLFSAYMVYIGKIPQSALISIFYLVSSINNPLKDIAVALTSIKSTEPNVEKVEEILNENNKVGSDYEKINSVMPLKVKDLSFGYEADKNVLENINFTFEENKKYAIVGNSGCGKSTFVKLLMKYYDDYKGDILWDGHRLNKIDKENLCEYVSMIHQKVFLFEDTMKNNITMYQNYNEDDIEYAIEASGLKEMLGQYSEGLDLLINENGNNFSGGEQQRISIARAILRKAKVLILDEATSSLDKRMYSQIERLILKQSNMTVINVTHRLDADILSKYDCIIALNQGKIVESGKFDELMNNKGFFYGLYTVSEFEN